MTLAPAQPAGYPQWKAPAEDGHLLIWPAVGDLLGQTRDNHRRLGAADSVLIQNVPLPELRRAQRRWVGHENDEQLLIATGHQTELYHPGVWVKNLLIDQVARALAGQAYHFAVDSDEPKHLMLRWLGAAEPITDDAALKTAAWSGRVAPPTPRHVQLIDEEFARDARAWDFAPMLPQFLHGVRRLLLEADNISNLVVNACHELDWDLGLRHHALVTSPLYASAGYLALVHHVLARADAFGGQYNAALDDYRRATGMKGTTRPMPDLKVSPDVCEVPFWLDRLDVGTRTRAAVIRIGSGGPWRLVLSADAVFEFELRADGLAAAEALARFLRQHQVRLSPRALTLTMFFRLLLVDQFVHGIGGGRYDQVLDRLIYSHFGLAPPHFSVTTATMYAPQALTRPRTCLPCVLQEGHKLRHRLLADGEKMKLVHEITSLPRRSPERSRAFHALHRRLDAAAATHPAQRAWQQKLDDAHRRLREDEVLFNRELFYAMQPRHRLEEMITRYAEAMAG